MIVLAILISYLVGSIPTAYIFGRLYKNIDIRQHGSGNIGATNVFRVLGKGPGSIVLLLDILKGLLVVVFVSTLLGISGDIYLLLISLSVVAGHNWTVFLKFKGGKGIATSLGVLIGLAIKIAAIRPVLLITVAVWLVIFLVMRFVSLSSIIAATVLPLAMLATEQSSEIICLGAIFCVWIVFRHRPNIKRLLSGQEPQVNLWRGRPKDS